MASGLHSVRLYGVCLFFEVIMDLQDVFDTTKNCFLDPERTFVQFRDLFSVDSYNLYCMYNVHLISS